MDILYVTGTSVSKCGNTRYTSGMVGAKIRVIYDETWNGMAKVICFTNGCVQRDVVATSDIVEIPHEVLAEPFKEFKMGFYGSAEKTATPTVWCSVGNVLLGTDPNGDETVDPTNPVYIQILNLIGGVTDLKTVCKKDLVCAINEIYEMVNAGGNVDEEAIKKLIAEHNISAEAHNDIRLKLAELAKKLNAFLDSDDTTLDQLTELIQAIKANQGTIEKLTNGKVNVSDIVNSLTTSDAKKPLSAAMGMELKRLIDAIKIPSVPTKTSQLQNDSGFITSADIPAIPKVPSWAMQPQKPEYTAQEVGAIADSELQNAIDQALQRAKQSGLFDGKDGATPKFASVKVTTLGPSSKATASITGSIESLVLNLGIPRGKDGENGGYYSPVVTQPSPDTMRIEFAGSLPDMPPVDPTSINLPKGGSGSDISLGVTGASIDQIVEIEEVDESGKPKRWKAVDKPSGGGGAPKWVELINKTIKVESPVTSVTENLANQNDYQEYVVFISFNAVGKLPEGRGRLDVNKHGVAGGDFPIKSYYYARLHEGAVRSHDYWAAVNSLYSNSDRMTTTLFVTNPGLSGQARITFPGEFAGSVSIKIYGWGVL